MSDVTRPAMTSREKIEAYMRGQAASAPDGDMLAAAAVTLLPTFLARLPSDSAELDSLLLRYAAIMLHLRSDGALPAELHVPGVGSYSTDEVEE